MFVPFERDCRIAIGVVALGTPDRLFDCLASLMTHDSAHDFTIVCVVNAITPQVQAPDRPLPEGVHAVFVDANLGWAGGLHRARAEIGAEYFVWAQEDMTVLPGWLDALVDAADQHPEGGAFGAVGVGADGRPDRFAAGRAFPPDEVDAWNRTDETREHLPDGPTAFDWVTSKGMLTRTRAWDDVHGTDPRLFPLHHVDKDYSTHLRCHGWDVLLVPDARLHHLGSQAAPSEFRSFLARWLAGTFNARWAPVVRELEGRSSAVVDHDCAPWRRADTTDYRIAGDAVGARMLVPFARAASRSARTAAARALDLQGRLDAAELELERMRAEELRARRELARLRAVVAQLQSSRSWRITAPLRRLPRFRRGSGPDRMQP